MKQENPARRILTMIGRIRDDKGKETSTPDSPRVTLETVDAVTPDGQFVVAATTLSTTGNGQNVKVGSQVPVAWKDGKPEVIIDHHAQAAQPIRALPGGGGIVEELFIGQNAKGDIDVYFRNDQLVTPLGLDQALAGFTANQIEVGWGLDAQSFFVALGDQTAPTTNFKIEVYTITRTPTTVIASNKSKTKPTLEKTWLASSLTLHLATVNFDGQLYGAYEQTASTTIGKLVLIDWNDSLEIEFSDMLAKGLLKIKSIVLDEAHDLVVLFSADVERRRSGFSPTFPRTDVTHFVDSTETPDQPNGDGGTFDFTDSFFDGPPSSFQKRILREAAWSTTDPKPAWTIDPGVHFFLCNVTTPARLWKTLRDPFNFVWRKTWVCSPHVDGPTALASRRNFGRVFYGINDWNAFLTSQSFPTQGGVVGDLLIGAGPATVHGKTVKAGATFRDPVDTGLVGFADGEQENTVSFTGALLGGPPALPINEQGSSYSFSATISGRPATVTGTPQITWTRTLQRLFRSLKWNFDTQQPIYLGRRTTGAKGATYKPPATLGIVAMVGERQPGASGFTYVPVTILGANPTLADLITFTDGPNGTIPTFAPYPATTLDDITGAEDFTGVRQISVAEIDIKTSVAHLLRSVFNKAMSDTLVVNFLTSDEFHIQFTQLLNSAGQIYLVQTSSGLSDLVGTDVTEYTGNDFRLLRPDEFYQAAESKLRFVLAWDQKTGVPNLLQTNPVAYKNDPKLLGKGFLLRLGSISNFSPKRSYQAIDDKTQGVNLKVAGT